MKLFTTFFLIVIVVVSACKPSNKRKNIKQPIVDTIKEPDKKNISKIGVSLRPSTKKEIAEWKEYQLVKDILTNYYAISNAEALSNAQELNRLVINLKDSIRDEKLTTPAVQARINILHNECMRLNDMANIPAISPEEVTATTKRILEAFSGLNAKLNSVYSLRDLESDLELDPDFLKILNDTSHSSPIDLEMSIPQKPNIKSSARGKPKQQILKNKDLEQLKETDQTKSK